MTSTAEICLNWAQTLRGDAGLLEFVRQACGADLHIFVGYDEVREFGVTDCPYVVMQPVEDGRGPEREANTYGIALFLGIVTTEKYRQPQPHMYVHPALVLMEEQFAPAIMTSLAGSEYPPEQADGEISPVVNGYCEKNMLVTFTDYNTLGMGSTVWK